MCNICPQQSGKFIMTGLSGKMCNSCHDAILQARKGNLEAAKNYFENVSFVSNEARYFVKKELSETEGIELNQPQYVKSNFVLVDGIPSWGQNVTVVMVELLEDRIVFSKAAQNNSPTVSLMLTQVTETTAYTEKEILEKSKSVVGRAAVGSLFGPVGAIIGAVSGTGKKQQTKTDLYYTISYISSSGTPAIIVLKCGCMGCHMSQFDSALHSVLQPKPINTFL